MRFLIYICFSCNLFFLWLESISITYLISLEFDWCRLNWFWFWYEDVLQSMEWWTVDRLLTLKWWRLSQRFINLAWRLTMLPLDLLDSILFTCFGRSLVCFTASSWGRNRFRSISVWILRLKKVAKKFSLLRSILVLIDKGGK